MENKLFKEASRDTKVQKLQSILSSQLKGSSSIHISRIIDSIDLDKQYIIHITHKIEKFKNIVAFEHIETSNYNLRSFSVPIYGSFLCGSFKNIFGNISKTPSKCSEAFPAAAVKEVAHQSGTFFEKAYHLVIYAPQK